MRYSDTKRVFVQGLRKDCKKRAIALSLEISDEVKQILLERAIVTFMMDGSCQLEGTARTHEIHRLEGRLKDGKTTLRG